MTTIGHTLPLPLSDIARMPLQAENCTLVVVDIQEKLLPPIFNKEQLVRNASLLIRLANILEIPIVVSTQYAKGLGETVPLAENTNTDGTDNPEGREKNRRTEFKVLKN